MLTKNKLLIIFAALINWAFALKYGNRYLSHQLAHFIAILAGILPFLLYFFAIKHHFILQKKWLIVGIIVITILLALPQYLIEKENLQVDRWSVISSFWEKAATGEQPYSARSHMNNPPGPFPTYFYLLFPFYTTNTLGLVTAVAWLLMAATFRNIFIKNPLGLFFLTISAAFWYEAATYSTLFFNGVISCLGLKLMQTQNNKFYKGIVAGLIATTRGITLIPLGIWLGQFLNRNKKIIPILILFCGGLAAVLLAFLPIILPNSKSFLHNNPIVLQTDFFLPFYITITYILMCALLGWIYTKSNLYNLSAIAIMAILIIYWIYGIYHATFNSSFYNSGLDLSYAAYWLPFAAIAISSDKKDRF